MSAAEANTVVVEAAEEAEPKIELKEEKAEVEKPQASEDTSSNNYSGNIDIRDVICDERPLRIYLDGVFDMTHYGHYRLFKSVKDRFPNATIVVGVAGEEETLRLKGQTLFSEAERAESIAHCKWVDEVVCPCPWIVTQEFLDAQKIDYVAHDGDAYVSAGSDDIYAFVKKQGKFIATQRTEGVSTTGIINRIVKRYNEFVLRNLQRGVDRKDLNLSWTRQKRIELGDSLKKNTEAVTDAVKDWIEDPTSIIDDFLEVFGPRGRLVNKVREEIDQMKEDFVEYAQFSPM